MDCKGFFGKYLIKIKINSQKILMTVAILVSCKMTDFIWFFLKKCVSKTYLIFEWIYKGICIYSVL